MKRPLTGQIITRPLGEFNVMGNPLRDGDKRVLVAIVGIVAVDPESPLNVEGRQFVISGSSPDTLSGDTGLVIMKDGSVDRSKEIGGHDLGRPLLEPIWRV